MSGDFVSHVLHAVVGSNVVVAELASCWHQARLVDLPQGFAMVPLTALLHDDIVELAHSSRPDSFLEFERLSHGVEAVLGAASSVGRLGYIETDYSGGCGSQAAIAWERGRVWVGPFKTETTWDGTAFRVSPTGGSAINRVLAALGVWTRGETDEFDMLGLGHIRSTEKAANRRIP